MAALKVGDSRYFCLFIVQNAVLSFLFMLVGSGLSLLNALEKCRKLLILSRKKMCGRIWALVGDLAWRCIILNPHLGEEAARKSSGVVLIDELDMHLHPSWQQRIIDKLKISFPNLQFIVSTHSPQILSCAHKECIRIITLPPANKMLMEPVNLMHEPTWQTRGVGSADILCHIMVMDSVPDVEEAHQLSQYRALIQNGQHDSEQAQTLRSTLERHFGIKHEEIIECDRLIALEAFKRNMASRTIGGA